MKPQISTQRRSHRSEEAPVGLRPKHPVTDYHYHPKGDDLRGSNDRLQIAPPVVAPSFRDLSSDFLGTEMKRNYIAEALLFAIIVGVSAWPIVSMFQALAQLVK
jgi:hypothetical protein